MRLPSGGMYPSVSVQLLSQLVRGPFVRSRSPVSWVNVLKSPCMLYRGLVAYTSCTRDHTLIGYYFPPPHLPTIPMHDRKLRIQRVAFIDQKRRGSKLFLSVIDSFAANYLQVFFSFFSLSLVFNYILYSILLIFIE